MKNLAKPLVLILVLTTSSASFAQNFSIKAGLNLSKMLEKDDDGIYSDEHVTNPGFHIGATAELTFNDILSFETGLLLSTKGYKYREGFTFSGGQFKSKANYNLLYLDIPLTGKASFISGGSEVYGLFGPYIGIGLSGKYKSERSLNDHINNEEYDVEWGGTTGKDLKRLDLGLTLGAGVKISSIQIGLAYNLGLANIAPLDRKISNRVVGLSVGYEFGGK